MTGMGAPFAVSGYVLAGGKSSRMGRDKALLELGGRPLVAHAVGKLQRLCEEVHVLSANAALADYASLVPDLHPGCGPLGGIEAALGRAAHPWSLILPVDVPFLPLAVLSEWVATTLLEGSRDGTRLAMFLVDGRPQPTLLMIHRDLAPAVAAAVARRELKVLPVLVDATDDLASRREVPEDAMFRRWVWDAESALFPGVAKFSRSLCFANLNTPEEFSVAEAHVDALDPLT